MFFLGSAIGFLPFLSDWILNGDRSGHLQSIVIASVLAVAGVQVAVLAVLADMMRNQRVVSQRILERIRRLEIHGGVPATGLVTTPSATSASPEDSLADLLPEWNDHSVPRPPSEQSGLVPDAHAD